jgi:hypothetical protein
MQSWRKGYFLLSQDWAVAMPMTARNCVRIVDAAILKAGNKKGS